MAGHRPSRKRETGAILKKPISMVALAGTIVLATILLPGAAAEAAVTRLHIRMKDASTGALVPAMVCITGSDGRVRLPPDGRVLAGVSTPEDFMLGVAFQSDPRWIGPVRDMGPRRQADDLGTLIDLPPPLPYWKEPVEYQTPGEFSITLPEGRWRIAVDHGMEYVPVVEEITLRGERARSRTITLRRWIDLPSEGWWSGDVHVHHPTVERSQREFLLRYARATDVHVVNVLEMGHHYVAFGEGQVGTEFKQRGFGRKFRLRKGNTWIVSGQEEPRAENGHVVGLNIDHLFRDMNAYDFYDIAFDGIHAQKGALVGFAHFAWNGYGTLRGFPWYVTTGGIDYVELLQFNRINTQLYHDYLDLGFRLTAAAGSDVPWGATMGEVRTYVYTGRRLDLDAWFDGLRRGRTFVSNGPGLEFTVDGQLPGSEIDRRRGDQVTIRARARSHPAIGVLRSLTLFGDGGVIQEVTNPGRLNELSIQIKRPIAESQWLAASAVCENGAVAHTSPVYVVVDARPTWSARRLPALVDNQLRLLELIGSSYSNIPGDTRGQGMHQRLDRARDYYRKLLAGVGK